jgi:hypothetical protein
MKRKSKLLSMTATFVIFLLRGTFSTAQSLPTFEEISHFSSSNIPFEWVCSEDQRARAIADAKVEKRLIDIFSWQSFIAVNWPVFWNQNRVHPSWEAKGAQPIRSRALEPCLYNRPPCVDKELVRDGDVPRWMTWTESYELFVKHGTNSGKKRKRCGTSPVNRRTRLERIYPEGRKELVYDQNGQKVYYEIFANDNECREIRRLKLDSAKGQKRFANRSGQVVFQPGECWPKDRIDQEGAIELKLAWKVLGGADTPSRFLTRTVEIWDEETRAWKPVEVGLVGMHTTHKTKDHMQWIWSTFEHVDNVRANPLPGGGNSSPSFYDPTCSEQDCPPNDKEKSEANKKAQLTRTRSIEPDTTELNKEVQALLGKKNSVLQYYELIGTQYIPLSATDRSFDDVTPDCLRNTVLEPYLTDSQCKFGENAKDYDPHTSSCMACHMKFAWIPSRKCFPQREDYSPADFSLLLERVLCDTISGH